MITLEYAQDKDDDETDDVDDSDKEKGTNTMTMRTTMQRIDEDGEGKSEDEYEDEYDDDVINVSNDNGRMLPMISMMMATTVRTFINMMTMPTTVIPVDDDGDDDDDDHVARSAFRSRGGGVRKGGVRARFSQATYRRLYKKNSNAGDGVRLYALLRL